MSKIDVYQKLKEFFKDRKEVELPGSKGAQGLKFNKKMFAMFLKGDLLLKFPPEKVQDLINQGIGYSYDPGTGKPMKDRVLILSRDMEKWIELCEESLNYLLGVIE